MTGTEMEVAAAVVRAVAVAAMVMVAATVAAATHQSSSQRTSIHAHRFDRTLAARRTRRTFAQGRCDSKHARRGRRVHVR